MGQYEVVMVGNALSICCSFFFLKFEVNLEVPKLEELVVAQLLISELYKRTTKFYAVCMDQMYSSLCVSGALEPANKFQQLSPCVTWLENQQTLLRVFITRSE